MTARKAHEHDAAGVARLRQALDAAAREAGTTQADLQQATAKFSAVAGEVVAQVGGSAKRIDKQLVESLQKATRDTNAAVAALVAVTSAARAAR